MADFARQAKAQNVNIVGKFEANLAELLAVLGKSDVSVMAPGSAMKIYKSSGELKADQVAEGAEIAASTHKMDASKTVELTYSKYRKVTGIESIGKLGYDVAVLGSNEAMLRDVQKAVRKSIYDGIARVSFVFHGSAWFVNEWRNMVAVICLSAGAESEWLT